MVCEGWEGGTVDGKFPLLEWLGGWAGRCVFLTVRQGTQKASIKLIVASGDDAEAKLANWETARALSHPCFVQLMESGRYTIQGSEVVYLVMEKTDAFLSGIVPRKSLDSLEVKTILEPLVDALAFLHEKGLVHGSVKPSNIVEVEGHWKLVSDEMAGSGGLKSAIHEPDTYDAPEIGDGPLTPAADLWSLGMIVVEAFAQRTPTWDRDARADLGVPATVVPEPFREIARGCLRWEPAERISIADVKELLSRTALNSTTPELMSGEIKAAPVVEQVAPEPNREDRRVAVEPDNSFPELERVEFAPRSRMFTNLEDDDEHAGRKGSIVIAILVLLAVVAVVAVRGFRGRLFSSGATANAPAQNQSAPAKSPQNETGPGQSAPANPSQPAPPSTQNGAAENQGTPPSQPAPENRPPRAESAPAVTKLPEPVQADGAKNPSPTKPEALAPEPKEEPPLSPANSKGAVLKRVLPNVGPGATGSMRRLVDVELRVSVNEDGKVSNVEYMTLGPGNYFARKARQAAQSWKFKPPQSNGQAATSEWILLFRFERRKTDVTAAEVR